MPHRISLIVGYGCTISLDALGWDPASQGLEGSSHQVRSSRKIVSQRRNPSYAMFTSSCSPSALLPSPASAQTKKILFESDDQALFKQLQSASAQGNHHSGHQGQYDAGNR